MINARQEQLKDNRSIWVQSEALPINVCVCVGGRSQLQELEANGYTVFSVKSEEPWMMVLSSFLPVYAGQNPSLGNGAAHREQVFPSQLSQPR